MFESVYAEVEVDVNLLIGVLSHSLRQHLSVQPRVHRRCLPPHLACSWVPISIFEAEVTGSPHCHLVHLWLLRLQAPKFS